VLDRWPAERVVRVPLSPFAGLAAARVFAADGTAQGVPLTSFRVDTLAEPGRIELTAAVPDPGRDFAGIELDVVAGYGPLASDVPMPLRQAIRMLAARWYENRGDGPPLGETALPVEVTALTAPYRRARL
jgi:uncharacterized phiE125 gp8 family phage protein